MKILILKNKLTEILNNLENILQKNNIEIENLSKLDKIKDICETTSITSDSFCPIYEAKSLRIYLDSHDMIRIVIDDELLDMIPEIIEHIVIPVYADMTNNLPKKYILNLTKIIKDGFNKIIFHKIAEKINIFKRRKRNKQSL